MRRKSWVRILISFLLLVAVASLAAAFYFRSQNKEIEYDFILAERKDLVQFVSVTGNVQPVEEVNLAFEVTGRVEEIFADVGDAVEEGDPLIKLVNADLSSELSKAQADLQNQRAQLTQLQAAVDVEEARLEELDRGTRDEEIEVAQRRLTNAQKARIDAELELANTITLAEKNLDNLYDTGKDRINDAYVAIDDVLRVKTDDLFSDSFVDEGDLVFIVEEQQTEAEARNTRRDSLRVLDLLQNQVFNMTDDQDELDQLLEELEADLLIVQNHLFVLSLAITQEVDLSDSLKTTFQNNIILAREAISASKNQISTIIQQISAQKVTNKNSIDTAQNALNAADNAIDLAQDELDLARAGTRPEQITSQKARIEQAKANVIAQQARIQSAASQVTIVQTNIEKTILRAPIAGIVTKQDTKVGEIVTLRESLSPTVVSIISDKQFEIEANIPEVDIAKIKLGDTASVTLDAYGDDQLFETTVSKIDPAETVVEGVPTYKVTFIFTENDDRIKSGMTANIEVLTAEVDNVIAIPQRTVLNDSGRRYIRVLENGEIEERSVQTGLTSWDGQVEVLSGLEEGEAVITFIES